MRLRTQNILLAGVIITVISAIVGFTFYVGHTGGYSQGFSDGTDSTISVTKKSTLNLHAAYKRSTAKVDSLIAIYDAQEVESFPNHSEIKP